MELQISGRDISKTVTNTTEIFLTKLIHIKSIGIKQKKKLHDCPFNDYMLSDY